jgi:hypothetical protein
MSFNRKLVSLFFILTIVCIFSCEDDQPTYVDFSIYKWSKIDENGGDWKPIILSSNEAISVPIPDENTVASELQSVKDAVNKITTDQENTANYWTNNPAIRWNEIARDLAAKYNLAPAANPDGTYSVPDAANPSTYPLFPFAHPPYASRAFAYLSVATFDALIATWHYKYKYNRPSIQSLDNTIKPFYGENGLPSYPSDGAVITATSQTILSAMFPLEKDFIAAKAKEHLESLSYTGTALASDISAGVSLGTEVAKKALARASTDRMKFAQVSKTVADSIKNEAIARFGWSFKNLDIPERKIGLVAKFGQVKTWVVSDLAAIRPPLPPKPGSAEYKVAADELVSISKKLTSEQRKIANQWADGTSTYTPPGHWNRIACDAIIEQKFNPLRTARTLAYMNMAIMDAGIACWEAKYFYHYPRPNQIIEGFKTILGTPNFPGYVSGHSTFSAAGAAVLSYIFPQSAASFNKQAKEASESRIYGGIHFRFDCAEGLILGQKIGLASVTVAMKDGAN